MICIVKIKSDTNNSPEPSGWIIVHDIHEARRQATDAGERELAQQLYQVPETLQPGSYEISDGLWVLVN